MLGKRKRVVIDDESPAARNQVSPPIEKRRPCVVEVKKEKILKSPVPPKQVTLPLPKKSSSNPNVPTRPFLKKILPLAESTGVHQGVKDVVSKHIEKI